MAPCFEDHQQSNEDSQKMQDIVSNKRNVTTAVNYEVTMVNQFLGSVDTRKKRSGSYVENVPESTGSASQNLASAASSSKTPSQRLASQSCTENTAPNVGATRNSSLSSNNMEQEDDNDTSHNNKNNIMAIDPPDSCMKETRNNTTATRTRSGSRGQTDDPKTPSMSSCSWNDNNNNPASNIASTTASTKKQQQQQQQQQQRRSTRERSKREAPLARSRVRYDMQMVPPAQRNAEFLKRFPMWWMPRPERPLAPPPIHAPQQQQQQALSMVSRVDVGREQPRRSNRLLHGTPQKEEMDSSNRPCRCGCNANKESSASLDGTESFPSPFEDDLSVIWIPSKRSEWEDSIDEMTALCSTAAIRRHASSVAKNNSSKPFHAPLSRDYIRDRVDIDDPLHGYQIRHRTGGWLQGFILWTNFTTWTHYFKWDSRHPKSGLSSHITTSSETPSFGVDYDGSLADELERQPRSGDPSSTGIVFPGLAEIALVGGLGCGEYLLRMALESIRAKKQYKFVVLQATDQSKTFYERFGFVRVGAVCRYGATGSEEVDCSDGRDPTSVNGPLMGYRHWTHANESQSSLQMHGGPSYMMCLRLPDPEPEPALTEIETCGDCGRPIKKQKPPSFLDEMLKLAVDQKPTVEQLGTTGVPTPKPSRKNNANSATTAGPEIPSSKKKTGRKTPIMNPQRSSTTTTSAKKKGGQATPAVPVQPPEVPSISSPSFSKRPATTTTATPKRPAQEDVVSAGTVATATQPSAAKRRRLENNEEDLGETTATFEESDASINNEDTADLLSEPSAHDTEEALNEDPVLENIDARDDKVETAEASVENQPDPAAQKPPEKEARATGVTEATPVKEPRRSDETPSIDVGKAKEDQKTPTINLSGLLKMNSNRKPVPIVKNNLLKQKVKSYPRSRVHFFNRVVKPKNGPARYYFVLNYDEQNGIIRIVPMVARGRLSGKREGRPRFQAVIGDTDANFETVLASDYEVVSAVMVMKTPIVASEAWDIEDYQE